MIRRRHITRRLLRVLRRRPARFLGGLALVLALLGIVATTAVGLALAAPYDQPYTVSLLSPLKADYGRWPDDTPRAPPLGRELLDDIAREAELPVQAGDAPVVPVNVPPLPQADPPLVIVSTATPTATTSGGAPPEAAVPMAPTAERGPTQMPAAATAQPSATAPPSETPADGLPPATPPLTATVPSATVAIPPTPRPASPTNAPIVPTSTVELPTDTPEPPTATTAVPTATTVTPTITPVPPTQTLPTRAPTPAPTSTSIPTTAPTSPPTSTPEPPTSTPEPPTSTPEPPTSTPEPPTSTPTSTPVAINAILECTHDNGDGTFTALFGYRNDNPYEVSIPIGDNNRFNPDPQDRGQPSTFAPGRAYGVFSVTFNDNQTLTWLLNGRSSSAGSASPRC